MWISEGIRPGCLEGPQMAAGAIFRLVRRESCQRWTFRESVLTAVRRVVSIPPIPTPCHGSHRYTAAPTSRSPCVRSEALSQKRLCVISKRSRSGGHQERTPGVFHPPCRSFCTIFKGAGCEGSRVFASSPFVHARPRRLSYSTSLSRSCSRSERCHSASSELGVQPHRSPMMRSVLIQRWERLAIFEGPSEGSSSDSLQDAEPFGHISAASYEFEMLQVGLALRGHNRTVPIRLIHAGQHPFDHVFCLIVESFCFVIATTTCF